MENPTYIALSKLDAQQRVMDVIAGNMANVNTPGYKAQRVLFSDFLVAQSSPVSKADGDTLSFTQDRATYLDRSAGSLTVTGNPLDIALSGNGYFSVQTAGGQRLTRAGRFQLLQDGTIADPAGNALLDVSGNPIKLPPGDGQVQVAADGTLNAASGSIGRIAVFDVADSNQLFAEGDGLYRSAVAPRLATQAKMVQGAVEQSNVQAIRELTQMMQTQRTFQFVSQFVESEADRQQNTIDKILQPQG